MKPENAIEVNNITKSFKVYLDKGSTLKEKVIFKNRRRYEERQVLKGISFEVKKGEAIGLIGHNGCGKSTTLKLLTKIMYPDSGAIEMRGRVSSLIELGAGFHPDMSGRENIYINASIFGLTRKEIDQRLEDIIAFSELEEFIDNPVRTYSSGMYMRLAFSVAINVDADILLIDEILAVGDVSFQAKCFNKLREIKGQGTTIVIVSHTLSQIEQICERSIWIDKGLIREEGIPTEVHVKYMNYMSEMSLSKELKEKKKEQERQQERQEEKEKKNSSPKPDSKGNENVDESDKKEEDEDKGVVKEEEKQAPEEKIVSIDRIYLCDQDGNEKNKFSTGQPALLKIEYRAKVEKLDKEIMVGILIFRNDGLVSYGTNTRNEGIHGIRLEKEGTIEFRIEELALITGQYWIDIAVRKMDMFAYDYCSKGFFFDVMSTCNEVGVAKIKHEWLLMHDKSEFTKATD